MHLTPELSRAGIAGNLHLFGGVLSQKIAFEKQARDTRLPANQPRHQPQHDSDERDGDEESAEGESIGLPYPWECS
jgi:hypothetical protein